MWTYFHDSLVKYRGDLCAKVAISLSNGLLNFSTPFVLKLARTLRSLAQTLGGSLSIASKDVVRTKPATITNFHFVPLIAIEGPPRGDRRYPVIKVLLSAARPVACLK